MIKKTPAEKSCTDVELAEVLLQHHVKPVNNTKEKSSGFRKDKIVMAVDSTTNLLF